MGDHDKDVEPRPAILTLGPLRPSDYTLDHFIAPELSRFATYDLPTVASEPGARVNRFIMVSIFKTAFNDPHRALLFNLCRRTEVALHEYALGRDALSLLKDASRTTVSPYFLALRHLEAVISNLDEGWAFVGRVLERQLFEANDDSILQRLRWIHNASKHADEWLWKGKAPVGSTLAVWLTNEGITCQKATISYQELGGQLEGLASECNSILQ